MSQVDPWEKAADCERALRITVDPVHREALSNIRSGLRSRRRAGFSATRLSPRRSKRLADSKPDSTATPTREFADNPSRKLGLGAAQARPFATKFRREM